jgi:hypothetical protein
MNAIGHEWLMPASVGFAPRALFHFTPLFGVHSLSLKDWREFIWQFISMNWGWAIFWLVVAIIAGLLAARKDKSVGWPAFGGCLLAGAASWFFTSCFL